ncbi:MAG: flagellar export protein FliJ [Oscillospiraceae bacterium]|nr:flagellar export protein FliJ [Oscillospiraceae bacterium]
MKAFRFTLHTLLNVKYALEKRHKNDIANCMYRIAQLNAELDALRGAFEAAKGEYAEKVAEGLTPADMEVWSIGFRVHRERVKKQVSRIKRAEDELAALRKKLLEIMTERKSLELLREKQLEEYRMAVKAEEAAQTDEFLANRIHARAAAPAT